jgi:hypothetical protein
MRDYKISVTLTGKNICEMLAVSSSGKSPLLLKS